MCFFSTFVSMKDRKVIFKASEQEETAFKKAAELSGLTLSAWIRNKLRIEAKKELLEAGKEVDFLKDINN